MKYHWVILKHVPTGKWLSTNAQGETELVDAPEDALPCDLNAWEGNIINMEDATATDGTIITGDDIMVYNYTVKVTKPIPGACTTFKEDNTTDSIWIQ
jgi:hypothetical protein